MRCENSRKLILIRCENNCKIGATDCDKVDKIFIKLSHTLGGWSKNPHTGVKIQDIQIQHLLEVVEHVAIRVHMFYIL